MFLIFDIKSNLIKFAINFERFLEIFDKVKKISGRIKSIFGSILTDFLVYFFIPVKSMTKLVGLNSVQCPSNNLAHPTVIVNKNDDATTSEKFDQIDLIDGKLNKTWYILYNSSFVTNHSLSTS